MQENLFNVNVFFEKFLKELEKEITNKEFFEILKKAQEIDSKYYKMSITIEFLKSVINEYKEFDVIKNNFKNALILLPGKPEIVFKLGIEAIRNDLNFIIGIEDFCLAQNTFLIETINKVIEKLRLKNKIELKNFVNDNEIIELSKMFEKTIIIGNSNLYNRLKDKIDVKLNSYGIFEIYSDSNEFEELQEMVFEIFNQNQFESEFYNDLEFDDAIRIINKQGYKFCSILFTKDKNKIKHFKENINSKYVIINENPFKKIKFNLEL